MFTEISSPMSDMWQVCWLVSVVLVVAAVIDGMKLKVPNWITFPMVLSGWACSFWLFGFVGLGWSLVGTVVGLALLMPAYAVGGMGAGDVKLMAGIGAWVWGTVTFYAFCLSAIAGGLIAVVMVLRAKGWGKHRAQFWGIINEFLVIRNPEALSSIAADRKGSMMLLPYGIPIAIGTIACFFWMGAM